MKLDKNKTYYEVVSTLGEVLFFRSKKRWFKKTNYIWKYKDSAYYHGPFNNLLDAMDSYNAYTKASSYLPVSPPIMSSNDIETLGNLIRVDFRNKKRIK